MSSGEKIIIKGSQPAVLESKMISQRRSSRSLSKLSNNSFDLIEGSSMERRGGVLIVLKETGCCGARSIRVCEGASVRNPQKNFTDLFGSSNLAF